MHPRNETGIGNKGIGRELTDIQLYCKQTSVFDTNRAYIRDTDMEQAWEQGQEFVAITQWACQGNNSIPSLRPSHFVPRRHDQSQAGVFTLRVAHTSQGDNGPFVAMVALTEWTMLQAGRVSRARRTRWAKTLCPSANPALKVPPGNTERQTVERPDTLTPSRHDRERHKR